MEKTRKVLEKILKDNETVIVACSSGADSMCLIDLILNQRKNKEIKIVCAHVNHNCRKQSEEEEKYLENYCKENEIIFELKSINEFTDNFQNDARIKRQAFFKELAVKYECKKIFTAHHADDLIETILMRITRGSNLNGYAGFKVINKLSTIEMIKPLIYYTKNEILNYNKVNNIKFYEDESNESDKYTRNRYRKEILPFLKSEDEKVHEKYLKFSEKLTEYVVFVDKYISNKKIIENDEIDLKLFNEESLFVKKRVLEIFIENIQEKEILNISDSIINEVLKMIDSKNGTAMTNLPGDFIAVKKKKRFYIKKI